MNLTYQQLRPYIRLAVSLLMYSHLEIQNGGSKNYEERVTVARARADECLKDMEQATVQDTPVAELRAQVSRFRYVLVQMLEALPQRRHWLDPDIERIARELIATSEEFDAK